MAESNKERQPITDSQRRKNELIAELARSRSGMTLHAGQVGYQTDVSRRVKLLVFAIILVLGSRAR